MDLCDKVLGTVCFECCNPTTFGLPGTPCRKDNHPKIGGVVEVNGACSGCPVAVIRGDGAPISKGQKDKVFGYLVPGPECEQAPTSNMTWEPCMKCSHATVKKRRDFIDISLNDLEFCVFNCPVKELRDALDERGD